MSVTGNTLLDNYIGADELNHDWIEEQLLLHLKRTDK